ncbi:aspartic protease inhibitor 11-like [Pyrus ussuriensis x Pyrus communis]|uniref:Aspartic protease inhibitor 11-like n=1 Tax=Pyrus ussuriensis x Pyrus communis TaxID=2448454 RepID=A0A5N5FQQ9_9ROSA|nr:aspartic protease inhibitor 11-like [Pyrus ussuriensis x Pyrus communis]
MMSMKFISSFLSFTLLMMAISTLAQTSNDTAGSPVLDTTGQPLQRGVEYYIKPAVTENGGRLIDRRNGTCPFYIIREGNRLYSLLWCPYEACPICKFNCRATWVGVLVENGKRLLALDGSALPVEFERHNID